MNRWRYGHAEEARTFVVIGNTVSIVHEHLWRAVLDVSNEILLSLMAREPLPRMEELRTPEVTNSNMTIVSNEHVARFDVVVDDT